MNESDSVSPREDKMKEADYIAATNLARVRIMKDVLRQILPGAEHGIDEQEERQVATILLRWEAALERKVAR